MRIGFLVLAFSLGTAVVASAMIPDLPGSNATCEPGALYATPAGTGPTLESIGSTVTVEVLGLDDQPVAGYPFQDVWLDDDGDGSLNVCVAGALADANTDAEGITTISGSLAAGGWTLDGLRVYLGGTPVTGDVLPIDVNSPDIDGDRTVNVTDVGLFATDYSSGTYSYRSDFDQSGTLDLVDVGIFAGHVGDTCP